jgi:NADH:ubiquinone oxidoreductase subunit K
MFLFIVAACYLDDISGFIFYFILLTLAGVEAAIGLSFLILFYRLRGILNLRYLHLLKS